MLRLFLLLLVEKLLQERRINRYVQLLGAVDTALRLDQLVIQKLSELGAQCQIRANQKGLATTPVQVLEGHALIVGIALVLQLKLDNQHVDAARIRCQRGEDAAQRRQRQFARILHQQ